MPGADHLDDGLVESQRAGRRHDLRDPGRIASGGVEHRARLEGIARHACFAQHMFAGVQRGHAQRGVHIRPGADTNRVDAVIVDDRTPIAGHMGDGEFVGDALTGLRRPVCNGDNLDPWQRL